jgi:hypothetical protein
MLLNREERDGLKDKEERAAVAIESNIKQFCAVQPSAAWS